MLSIFRNPHLSRQDTRTKTAMRVPMRAASMFGDALNSLLMRKGKVTDVSDLINNLEAVKKYNRDLSNWKDLASGVVPPLRDKKGKPFLPRMPELPFSPEEINKWQQQRLALEQAGSVVTDEVTGRHFFKEHDKLSPWKLGGGALGLGGLGVLYNAATTRADNPIQYKLQKALFGVEDRAQVEDHFVQGLSQQGGREAARLAGLLLQHTAGQAAQAIPRVPQAIKQQQVFRNVLHNDEYLQGVSPSEGELLVKSFKTMRKFAPELSTDEFAVRNFLRESLMAANGPDYSTISSMARADRDATYRG